ncbi:MAG: TM2 domain-containing protein [Chloroflexi bacterium]|jgi:hypothetical protein|nr:TM2 domain-containing protein [Chloroflexota bacterium]
MQEQQSDKSFTTAVVLAAVFSLLGFHHFYVGRIGHGLFDLGMTAVALYLIVTGTSAESDAKVGLGFLVIALDYIHTVYFTYRLIIGTYRDGQGKLIKIG